MSSTNAPNELAGWRRLGLTHPPEGVIDLTPDWACEIVSPSHEKHETVSIPRLLQRLRLPWL